MLSRIKRAPGLSHESKPLLLGTSGMGPSAAQDLDFAVLSLRTARSGRCSQEDPQGLVQVAGFGLSPSVGGLETGPRLAARGGQSSTFPHVVNGTPGDVFHGEQNFL